MSNVIVTELVVDARGAEKGTATWDRAMKVAQAAVDRLLDRDNALRNAMDQTSTTMTTAAGTVTGAAKAWEKLRAVADPTVSIMNKIQKATLDADAAVRRGITTQAEADRVLEQYVRTMQASSVAGREAAREAQSLAAAQERAAQAAARNAAVLDDLRASHDGVYDASRRMAREVDELARLESAGIKIAGGYAAALDRIILKYDETAQAAAKAKAAQADMIRQAREDQNAANSKAAAGANHDKFSSFMGVGSGASSSARDSAQVFEEEARAAEKLREELNPLGAAYAKMLQQISAYEAMARRGTISTDEMSAAVRKAINGFHQLADSEAARETQALAAEQDRAAQAASRHAAMLDNLRASFDPAYASARNMARELSELTMLENAGIRVAGGYAAAREKIARKYDAGAQAADKEARAVAQLREELNPLAAAHARLNEKLESYQAMARRGAITSDELALATSKARREFDHSARNLRGVGDEARLSSHQVQNLGYQLNDAATMLLSGSSPFQVLATQGGQVVQALGDGPGGVKGALKAIGDSVLAFGARLGPVGVAVGVLGAAGAVALAMWPTVQDRIERVNASAEKFANTLRDIRRGSAGLADSIEQGVNRKLMLGPEELQDRLAAEQQRQSESIEQARKGIGRSAFYSVGWNPITWGRDAFQTVTGGIDSISLQKLVAEFTDGTKSASELRQELDRLQATGQVPRYLYGPIEEITKLTDASVEAEAKVKVLQDALANFRIAKQAADDAEKAGTAYEKFRGAGFDLETLKTERQRINEAFEKFKATSMGPLNPKDVQRYNEALRQLDAQDERARKGRELDIQQVGARTVAERARIAAERERLNLTIPGINQEKVAADAAAASQMVYAEAAESAAEALRSSKDAYAQAGLDGYAGQVAAINTQYARQIELAQGSDAAVRALTEARDLDLKTLEVSTRKSLFDGQEEELRRLQVEVGLIGQNDDARRKALATLHAESELRRQGIDLNSEWGRTYVSNAQQISDMDDALGKQQKTFTDLKEAASGFFDAVSSGGGVLDALASTFGRLGQQMASKGFDQLFGKILGNGGQNATGLSQALGAATNMAGGAPIYGSDMATERTFSAPVGAVTRVPLGPVEVTLPQSSGRAVEQAGNAFLNLIRKAEGTSGSNGYNTSLAYGKFTGGERNLTGMSLNQIDALQSSMLRHPENVYNSSALGAYQIVQKTLRGLRDELKLTGAELFSPEMQDKLATTLAGRRGANVAGLRNEWEGFRRVDADTILAAYQSRGPDASTTRAYERATERGVERGLSNALPPIDGGYAGVGRGGVPVPTPRPNVGGLTGSGSILGIQYPEFSALGGLTAGLGGFGAGYSSGSALGGGLQGALGGFMSGGPVGAVIGGISGLLGGVLGKKKQKKQEEEEAKRQWEGMQPQYEGYRRYLSGEESGNLRTDFQNIQAQFNQFNAASTKAKNGDLVETARSFYAYVQKQLSEFREAFEGVAADLEAGAGLDGPFAKGKSAVRQLQKQLQGYLDDVAIAYYQADNGLQGGAPFAAADAAWKDRREAALAKARRAAQDQALSVLNPPKELSAVESNFRSLQGAAQQLLPTLQKLGMNAADAARRIGEELNRALAKMAADFVDGFGRKINDLTGKGYLNDVADLFTEFDTALSNASLLNVDPAIVNRWFSLSAQKIVDGSELAGDAFADLVSVFPRLSGVVTEAGRSISASASEIEAAIRGYEDRLFDAQNAGDELAAFERRAAKERLEAAKFGADAVAKLEKALSAERAATVLSAARSNLDRSYQHETDRINDLLSARRNEASELESTVGSLKDFASNIAQFRKSLLVDDSLSTLTPEARVAEARQQFLDLAMKAQGGDEDARSKLTGAGQEYLAEARSFYASSERYHDAFDEVRRILDQSETAARGQLSTAESQLVALKRQIALDEAQLEQNKKDYEALLGINDGIKSLAVAMKDYAAAAAAARQQGITVPGTNPATTETPRNGGWTYESAAPYLAKNKDVAAAIAAGETFGLPKGYSAEVYASAHYGLFGQAEGRGWATGGYTGAGGVHDVAGLVHRGEVVWSQRDVASWGGPAVVDTMRMTRVCRPSTCRPRPARS